MLSFSVPGLFNVVCSRQDIVESRSCRPPQIAPAFLGGVLLASLALVQGCASSMNQAFVPKTIAQSNPAANSLAAAPENNSPVALATSSSSEAAATEDCNGNGNPASNPGHILPGGLQTTDLIINGVACVVDGTGSSGGVAGSYVYRNVNIYNGGSLTFNDVVIDFHAHSILVEKDSVLQAGGTSGLKGPLTIWLWGTSTDSIPSITCLSDSKNQCGVPDNVWNSNPNVSGHNMPSMPCTPATNFPYVPQGECFYPYEIFDANDIPGAYFGHKVLAVAAGGSISLTGWKGIRPGTIETNPADSSTSWVRLNQTLKGGENYLYVDRPVPTWGQGDHIVVTSTDYLPGHTEELVIKDVASDSNGTRIDIDTSQPPPMNQVQNAHWGETYDYDAVVTAHPTAGPAPDLNLAGVSTLKKNNIETRAIVALLTRSIRIASEGPTPVVARDQDHFPAAANSYFGGHTVVRDGFKSYQVQGVEFYQLGQGGAIGRYPVHFHMARSVPQPNATLNERGTFVADSSIVDSMTRFITVHATQGVTLARNVGYKSIGHGFFLEDATEINNRLYSNVGITVRAGLADTSKTSTNPRHVPGILNFNDPNLTVGAQMPDDFPYHSDVNNPSVFWISNTWNDFEYNAAVGAETCGACYWMLPQGISGPSQYESWTGYAGMQRPSALWGAVPMLKFTGNSCSGAMNSLQTVGSTNVCNGLYVGDGQSTDAKLFSVPNSNSPAMADFPNVGGQRAKTTVCSDLTSDCTNLNTVCTGTSSATGTGPDLKYCLPFVVDHYTTSFNWAQTNFAAIWLRGWWYMLENSAITDVQNGGVTFVSGGGFTRSDAAQGYWSVLKNSILVGNTQPIGANGFPDNPFASNAGPFTPNGLSCPFAPNGGLFCASAANGVTFQNQAFAGNQRLFNIYDGPSAELNNIYSDVHITSIGTVAQCKPGGNNNPGECVNLKYMNGYPQGVLQYPPTGKTTNECILPNAAIAWKQPNGFYYPPAFNSENLVFNTDPAHGVDIRHFVIQPLYKPNSFTEDSTAVQNTYCAWEPNIFSGNGFTDIDRQTELTDNDGSLTGLLADRPQDMEPEGTTISVNKDVFFNQPVVTDECASGQQPPTASGNDSGATVNASPYEHLTTAVVAQCATPLMANCGGNWTSTELGGGCSNPRCFGIPLYRQYVVDNEEKKLRPSIRMMGQGNAQRSSLTVNRGKYYIDTTNSKDAQTAAGASFYTVFQPNNNYYVFLIFANNHTKQTYSMFIGEGLSMDEAKAVMTPGRVQIPDTTYPFCTSSGDSSYCQACGNQCTGSWATFDDYEKESGLLTVTIDLSQQADLNVANRGAFCQPTTYCSWDSDKNTCGCKPGTDCTDSDVCSLGTKDLDCPVGGCYGFRISLPGNFAAQPHLGLPPEPVLYPSDETKWVLAPETVAGDCFYQKVPGGTRQPRFRSPRSPLSLVPVRQPAEPSTEPSRESPAVESMEPLRDPIEPIHWQQP